MDTPTDPSTDAPTVTPKFPSADNQSAFGGSTNSFEKETSQSNAKIVKDEKNNLKIVFRKISDDGERDQINKEVYSKETIDSDGNDTDDSFDNEENENEVRTNCSYNFSTVKWKDGIVEKCQLF